MSIVVVTQNQYLVASKIHYVNLNEHYEHIELGYGVKRQSFKEFTHTIHIVYTPDSQQAQQSLGRDDHKECSVQIRGKVNAHRIFRDLIRQIREQTPDQLYLDKALEVLLGKELDLLAEDEELLEAKEIYRDRSAKKVGGPRKTKRSSEVVLRKSKARNRSLKK